MTAPLELHEYVHRCAHCGARIVWAWEGRQQFPVDAVPSERGNLLLNLIPHPTGGVVITVGRPTRPQAEGAVSGGKTLHSHHAHTCTAAGDWYKKTAHGPAPRGFAPRRK